MQKKVWKNFCKESNEIERKRLEKEKKESRTKEKQTTKQTYNRTKKFLFT